MAPNPSTEELLGHHLGYEIKMLAATLHELPRSTTQVMANALMESFAVHARFLIEFFLSEGPRGANAFTSATYKPFAGARGRVSELNRKLNNQVSHLMESRTAEDGKKINPADPKELYVLIADAITHFKMCLNPDLEHIKKTIPDLPPLNAVAITGPRFSATNSVVLTTTASSSVSLQISPGKLGA